MDLVHPDSIYSGPVVGKDLNLNLGDYSPWNLLERLLCSRLSICVSAGQRIICASQKNTGWPIDTRGLVKSQAPSSSSSPLTLSNSGFQFAPHQPPPPSPLVTVWQVHFISSPIQKSLWICIWGQMEPLWWAVLRQRDQKSTHAL